jgi:nicotinamide-nucleotide amidase
MVSTLSEMLEISAERISVKATTNEKLGFIGREEGIAAMTDIPGSSSMVDRGFVTYSNDAKMEVLGVSPVTLDAHGAVSAETAQEMAAGALARSHAGIALAVTGIAGPDGGSEEKPVGLVWFGLALTGKPAIAEKRQFENRGRDFVRRETVRYALEMGLRALGEE